jgi:hypothetical protein
MVLIRIENCCRPSCDIDNPAFHHIAWFGLMTLIGMVRVFAGPQWQPTEIGLMSQHTPCHRIREQFPASRIQTSQPYSYLALENALLGLAPYNHEPDTFRSSTLHYQPLAEDFVGSLKQVLMSYIG